MKSQPRQDVEYLTYDERENRTYKLHTKPELQVPKVNVFGQGCQNRRLLPLLHSAYPV